jgi:20S proteasome subunit beta 2
VDFDQTPLLLVVLLGCVCVVQAERDQRDAMDPTSLSSSSKDAKFNGIDVVRNGGGFDFSNAKRNALLESMSGKVLPSATKTGTTIVGVVYNDGVVLGADTRATGGSIVCDKNCEKIHNISRDIWCCGAGTAADTEAVTQMVMSDLEIQRQTLGEEPRVVTAMTKLKRHLFKYQGHVSAALVLGGIDSTGAHLYTVWPHGSTDRLPYATMGSGSLAAMSVFESKYKDNLDEKEAVELVAEAIQAGIFNDLGSGSNVDVCVISKTSGVNMKRNYLKPNERVFRRKQGYVFPRGTTQVCVCMCVYVHVFGWCACMCVIFSYAHICPSLPLSRTHPTHPIHIPPHSG